MKAALILAAALVATTVQARPIAYIPNTAGGKIVFTSDICVANGGVVLDALRKVFTFRGTGEISEGCYYLDTTTNLLMVIWGDKTRAAYPLHHATAY